MKRIVITVLYFAICIIGLYAKDVYSFNYNIKGSTKEYQNGRLNTVKFNYDYNYYSEDENLIKSFNNSQKIRAANSSNHRVSGVVATNIDDLPKEIADKIDAKSVVQTVFEKGKEKYKCRYVRNKKKEWELCE